MKKETLAVGDYVMGKIEMNNHLLELTQYIIAKYKLQNDPFVIKKMQQILASAKSDQETINKLEQLTQD